MDKSTATTETKGWKRVETQVRIVLIPLETRHTAWVDTVHSTDAEETDMVYKDSHVLVETRPFHIRRQTTSLFAVRRHI